MDATLDTRSLELVLDVKVRLTVRLGSCQLPMKEILELTPGTVIQLDQQAREPVGLYVNEKLIAHGEVVLVDDAFGIKITRIVGKAS